MTDSMQKAMNETDRRRRIQMAYNEEHGITPQTIKKKIRDGLGELFDGNVKNPLQGENKSAAVMKKFAGAPDKIRDEIEKLRKKMKEYSANLEFEEAAKIRDEIKRLQIIELSGLSGDTDKKNAEALEDGLK